MEIRGDVSSENILISVRPREFMTHQLMLETVSKIADGIAERFIKENYAEIVKAIDPVALANLAIADAGAKINETLNKKMPDKIMEVTRTVHKTVERGFFGGIKRVY